MVMPLLDHFDILAPLYERVFPPGDSQDLCARLGLPVAGALLDAGGGTGRLAQLMRGKAGRIVVADLSLRMLAEANKKEGLNPVCALSEKLPFPDGFFERILMVDAFHHVFSQQQTAQELWRMLQPGGRLVIEEPDVDSFAVKWIAFAEKLALMRSHFFPPRRIAALFRFPGARVTIETGNHTAWITAEKAKKNRRD